MLDFNYSDCFHLSIPVVFSRSNIYWRLKHIFICLNVPKITSRILTNGRVGRVDPPPRRFVVFVHLQSKCYLLHYVNQHQRFEGRYVAWFWMKMEQKVGSISVIKLFRHKNTLYCPEWFYIILLYSCVLLCCLSSAVALPFVLHLLFCCLFEVFKFPFPCKIFIEEQFSNTMGSLRIFGRQIDIN